MFSQGSWPWIMGPWQRCAAQTPGGLWLVTCAFRILGGSGSSGRCPCPPLGSEMITMAYACLWSLLRWCCAICGYMEQEAPLLVHPKPWYLASLAGPDFFPDSLPASRGELSPFRLSSHSQHQSSPWGLTSKT